ncbi:MAG: hypothetical protein IPL65_04660 [Lewinellaceae bacterium]|nr:hypothetical protein [Lewinellaceae bacterium]
MTPPTAICKTPGTVILQLDANGMATLDPVVLDNGSSDNCGGISFSASKTTFNCADVALSPIAVTLTVTDNSMLTAMCATNVIIKDNQLPTLTCPANKVVPATMGCSGTPSGIAMALGNPTDPGFYNDNCAFGPNPVEFKIDGAALWTIGADAACCGCAICWKSYHYLPCY